MSKVKIVRAALVASGLAVAFIGAAREQGSACGCPDVADLRNRMCEARAAIGEYARQISMIRAQEARTGTQVMYTVDRYNEHVQPCVQEAINQVTDANANRPTADTNNACNITFKGSPTACLKQVLNAHEGVHVTVCKKWENDRDGFFAALRGTFSDFREGTTLVDLLNEERSAYLVEVNHVRDELERLSQNTPSCPGLPVQPPGPPRIPTIEPCPPPRPRPAPQDSACKHR
ncbi:MAG: hypothetical protein ACXWG9_05235 [Usitatibacter sp.]